MDAHTLEARCDVLRDEASFVARDEGKLVEWFSRLYTLISENDVHPAFVATIASEVYRCRYELDSGRLPADFIYNFSALSEEQERVQYTPDFCLYVLYCHSFTEGQEGFKEYYKQAAELAKKWLHMQQG